MKVINNEFVKGIKSENFNTIFHKDNGYTLTWGKNTGDDPQLCPFGPLLIDVEITEICKGPGGVPCEFCYKANHPHKKDYMSLDTWKKILNNLPTQIIQQIAFGVDAQCESNPDTLDILQYTRDMGIVPNITVADITQEKANQLTQLCGGVAVSRYENKDICYDSIQKLSIAGQDQLNMHLMISQETLPWIYETFNDYFTDSRLQGLNAIVLLSLKQKGRGVGHTPLTQDQFNEMTQYALEKDIPIGFDSCSYHKFKNSIQGHPNKENILNYCDPCESSLYSWYINTRGEGFPCSFVEGVNEWEEGIDMVNIDDFVTEVWYGEKIKGFREKLTGLDRKCPMFNI